MKKIKSFGVSILIVSMIMCFMSGSVIAKNSYLSEKEITNISMYHLVTYVNTEECTEQELSIDKNFILLNDTEGKLIAYLVPLINEFKESQGYMIVDARVGGYGVCEVSFNKDDTKDIMEKGDDLIYIFPYSIITKEELQKINEIKSNINLDLLKKDQNKTIDINEKSLIKEIEKINNEKFKSLPDIDNNCFQNYSVKSKENEEVSLHDESNFVKVKDGNEYYYGGNQSWFDKDDKDYKHGYDRGCGTVAAANIAYYMSQYVSGCDDLYSYSNLNKSNFVKHMKEVYDYVTPWYWGIPTLGDMKSKFEKFASDRDVDLEGCISKESYNLENVSNYIKDGLTMDSPVAMVIYNVAKEYEDELVGYDRNKNPDYYREFQTHWVTITKYFKNNTNGDRYVAVSSWGDRYSLKLQILLDQTLPISPSFIYFY